MNEPHCIAYSHQKLNYIWQELNLIGAFLPFNCSHRTQMSTYSLCLIHHCHLAKTAKNEKENEAIVTVLRQCKRQTLANFSFIHISFSLSLFLFFAFSLVRSEVLFEFRSCLSVRRSGIFCIGKPN